MKVVHVVFLFASLTGATCLFTRKYIFVNHASNWQSAQAYCRANYVDLSTINSEIDLANLKADAGGQLTQDSWIGLKRTVQETAFTHWSDGSQLEYTVWYPGQPKNSDLFLCVYVYNSKFVSERCSASLPFFCYIWAPEIIVVQEMMNWEAALSYCRTHYTDLVSLGSDEDLQALKSFTKINEMTNLWTGLRFMNGVWFWVNWELLGSLVSLSSCPIRPYHCGALKVAGYTLENRNCKDNMTFMCYYESRV